MLSFEKNLAVWTPLSSVFLVAFLRVGRGIMEVFWNHALPS